MMHQNTLPHCVLHPPMTGTPSRKEYKNNAIETDGLTNMELRKFGLCASVWWYTQVVHCVGFAMWRERKDANEWMKFIQYFEGKSTVKR